MTQLLSVYCHKMCNEMHLQAVTLQGGVMITLL